MRFHRTCDNCKTAFYDHPSNRVRFCSFACAKTFLVGKESPNYRGGGNIVCQKCAKPFYATPSQSRTKRFCSMNCYAASKRGRPTHSPEFYRQLGQRQTGPNSPQWKGGREHQKAVARLWIQNHRDSVRIRNAQRRARQRQAPGSLSLSEWTYIKRYYFFRCIACFRSEPEIKLTVDHIAPLIKGGSHNSMNIQPLCQRCNSGKRERQFDYRPELVRLLGLNIPLPREIDA